MLSTNFPTAITGGVSGFPKFEYTGQFQLIDDEGGNWRVKFLTSGVFTLLSPDTLNIDVFLVGGGGGGGRSLGHRMVESKPYTYSDVGGGGGGGFTATENTIVQNSIPYEIIIGAHGIGGSKAVSSTPGGSSSAFNFSVSGGSAGGTTQAASGGNDGGKGCSYLGNNDSYAKHEGQGGASNGNPGQGTTTREFGEPTGEDYAGGGGSAGYRANGGNGGASGGKGGTSDSKDGKNGSPIEGKGGKGGKGEDGNGGGGGGNYGGGGGGAGPVFGASWEQNLYGTAGDGGQGIVIIRNHRTPAA